MNSHKRSLIRTALVLGTLLPLGWPIAGKASHENFAVYEDWSQTTIRGDRWLGGESFGGQEVKREVLSSSRHKRLIMRLRRVGQTASNTGSALSGVFLGVSKPTTVDEIAATFTVTSLDMTTCAANNTGAATRARPSRLLLARFNDGTGSSGNRTGDHFAGIQAQRDGSSTDAEGVLRVTGFLNRCTNADCSTSTTVSFVVLQDTVTVGAAFTLQLVWDKPMHQFLFTLNDLAPVPLPYTASDSAEAIVPFVNLDASHTTANCTAGAVAVDSTTLVGTVRTNSSAVIP